MQSKNTTKFPPRHSLSRAQFFLEKSECCTLDQRDDFEAYLEASIVFARSTLHRLQSQYKKHPSWNPWWNNLNSNNSVEFFRNERNWILKEGPPKIGQIIGLGEMPNEASYLYYYENPNIRATDTVRKHLIEMERLVREAESIFNS